VYSEFSPSYTKNGLLFASDSRYRKLSKIQTYVESKGDFLDVYEVKAESAFLKMGVVKF